MGFSVGAANCDISEKESAWLKDVETEYSFSATQGSINCADGSQNLLAVGGYDETIRLFDVRRKKDLGELVGEHLGSITALQFFKNKYLISGAEDSSIVIWRCKDWNALHKLRIKNTSPVVAMSMHPSGKMLLAIYANSMMRLWDLMSARCIFKKKVGLIEEADPAT